MSGRQSYHNWLKVLRMLYYFFKVIPRTAFCIVRFVSRTRAILLSSPESLFDLNSACPNSTR